MKNHKADLDRAITPSDSSMIQGMPQDDLIQRGREDVHAYQVAAELLDQAIAALNAKEYQKAIEAFQNALQHNRESAEGYFYLGLAYFMVGDYENAAASYKLAIACEPADATAHLNLGMAYQLLKRYDEAIHAYQRSIALAPNNPETYSQLGSAYAARGKRQEAVAAYKEAIRIKLLNS